MSSYAYHKTHAFFNNFICPVNYGRYVGVNASNDLSPKTGAFMVLAVLTRKK